MILMRMSKALALAVFVLPLAIFALPSSTSSNAAVLPNVTAYALDNSKLTLPTDFSAPLNLLILSFKRDQQDDAATWLPVAQQNGQPAKVQTWTLPISNREDDVYRWWVNRSLVGSVPPTMPKHNVVPLYVDKARFLKSLAIASEKQIVVLLTDKAGMVLWRSSGAVTDDKKASLLAFLKSSSMAK
jgi:hypothetical protein